MKKILVTIPNIHWIHAEVVWVLLRIIQTSSYSIKIKLPSYRPYENNQHHIVVDFLQGDCDYWLSIDADNPPLNNPLDLIQLDKDIIGLPTPVWHYLGKPNERPIYWNAYQYNEKEQAYNEFSCKKGLQKVDAIGTGCFIVARRVFEHPDMQKGAFTRKLLPDGRVDKGNDISFCERAREAGFKIWCHFDYPCKHYCEIDLHQTAMSIKGAIENG